MATRNERLFTRGQKGGFMNLNDEIAEVAYQLFERDGRQHGKDQEHWLEAERIVSERHTGQVKPAKAAKTGASGPKKDATQKVPEQKKRKAPAKTPAKAAAAKTDKPAKTRTPRAK
jgi:hypothetical protein